MLFQLGDEGKSIEIREKQEKRCFSSQAMVKKEK